MADKFYAWIPSHDLRPRLHPWPVIDWPDPVMPPPEFPRTSRCEPLLLRGFRGDPMHNMIAGHRIAYVSQFCLDCDVAAHQIADGTAHSCTRGQWPLDVAVPLREILRP